MKKLLLCLVGIVCGLLFYGISVYLMGERIFADFPFHYAVIGSAFSISCCTVLPSLGMRNGPEPSLGVLGLLMLIPFICSVLFIGASVLAYSEYKSAGIIVSTLASASWIVGLIIAGLLAMLLKERTVK